MRLSKKLLSVIVAGSLLLGLAAPAFAAYPDGVQPAAKRMQTLGLVQGKGGSDLALNDNLTRAEAVTIIVRAFGQADQAKFLKGAPAFPDTANHWASGEIALAKNLIEQNGQSVGMPDGTFQPNGQLTVAQTVAFMLKFLGVKFTSDANWVANAFKAAVDAGVMTADDAAALKPQANNNATRGTAFYLADSAFAGYKLPNGKTVYQTYEVPNAPTMTLGKVTSPTTETSVTITGKISDANAKVWVNSPANGLTVDKDGNFSYTASNLAMGDTTFTFGAADLVNNTATAKVTVTRTVGAAATLDASDITVAAGQAVAFAPVVKDAKGNAITNATVTVTSDLGTFANGQFTAGSKAGTGTATVTSGTLTKTVNVTVNAGALATLTVTPATKDLASGASQKFTVAGVDANGNTVAVGTVTWTASKGVIGQDGTFGATTDAAGTVTVTATAGSVSGTATVNVYGAAATLSAAAPTNLVANGVTTGNLVVTALDANGNVAKNFAGTVSINGTPASFTVASASVTAVNGVATFALTSGTSANSGEVVSISSTGLAGTTATVVTAAQVPTSVKVTADPATVAADNTSKVNITAALLDQTGNPVKYASIGSDSYTVTVATSDASIIAVTPSTGAILTLGNVSGNVSYTDSTSFRAVNNLGTATLTGTVKKNSAASTITANSVSVSTALVGSPYKLAVDTITDTLSYDADLSTYGTQKVYVRVLDVNGNQVTSTTDTSVTLSLTADSTTASVATLASWTGGKAKFTVTDAVAETVNYTATGTWQVNSTTTTLTKATASGKFVPGVADHIALAASPDTLGATGTATSVLTATVQDRNNNTVTNGSYAVTFYRVINNGAIANWADTSVNTVNGVATLTVTGTTNNSVTDTFGTKVAFTGTTLVAQASTATVTTQIIGTSNKLAFGTSAYTGNAGTATTITVKVQDALGITNTSDNSTVVTLTVTDPNSVATTYTATAKAGVATFKPVLNTAFSSDYALKATATGLKSADVANTVANGATLRISPATTAAALKLTSNLSTVAADTTSQVTFTVVAVDAYGNTIKTANLTGVDITPSAGTMGSKTNLTNSVTANGSTTTYTYGYTQTWTSISAPATVTFTAHQSSSTLADVTASVNVITVGVANRLSVAVDADQTASSTPNQKVTVTILDAAGNRVTSSTAWILLTKNSTASAHVYADTSATAINSVYGVHAVAGQATFYVADTVAETATYTANLIVPAGSTGAGAADATVTSGSVSGTFTPGTASQVVVTRSLASIAGDGSSVSVITATVKDANNNTVTNASGVFKFSITSGNGAFLQNLTSGYVTVNVVGGKASAVIQSYPVYGTSDASVTVTADYWKTGDTSVTFSGHNSVTITHQ